MSYYNLKAIFQVVDKATKPLQKVGRSLGKVGQGTERLSDKFKEMSRKAIISLSKMEGGIRKLGPGLGKWAKRIGIGLTGIAVGTFKMSMDFNKAMANIATLIPGNLKRINELKKGVQSLAIESGKSTSDLSDGLYQVVSAFGDSSESMDQLRITSKAAIAGVASTTDALNLLSAVTKGYGDTSKEAMEKAADLAFTTVKLGQTTFPELAASMGRVIPLAAKLGVEQEELFSGFATLTGVTGNASEVSTQFAAIMQAMLKPTEDMKKAVKILGFESASTMLKEKGLVKTLVELMKYTKGNEEATAGLFGRAEALTAVFALSGKQLDDYNAKLKEHNRSTGATNRAYKEQTRGINKAGHSWERLKSSLMVLLQRIGDKLAPAIGRLAEKLIEVTEEGSPFLEQLNNIAKVIGEIIDGITTLIGWMDKMARKEKSMTKTLGGRFYLRALGIQAPTPTPIVIPDITNKSITEKTETDINLRIHTDDKSNVEIEKVNRKKGTAKVKIISEVGRTIPVPVGAN